MKFNLATELNCSTHSITVHALDGWQTKIDVPLSETVDTLKRKITEEYKLKNIHWPPEKQMLWINGRFLENGCYLSDYNLKQNSLIFLTLKLN